MTYDGSTIIRDENNNPIPQKWDDENQEWKAYGEIPTEVKQTGSIVQIDQISTSTAITVNAGATEIIVEDYDFSSGKIDKFKMNWYGNLKDENDCEMVVTFTNNEGNYSTSSGYVYRNIVEMKTAIGISAYTDEIDVRGKYMRIEATNNDTNDRFYRRFTIINNMPKGDR